MFDDIDNEMNICTSCAVLANSDNEVINLHCTWKAFRYTALLVRADP